MTELDVVRDVSRRFNSEGIDYMLTGSLAMSYYAVPRMTRDIDVVVALSGADPAQIADLFAPDYYVSESNIREAIAHQSIFNVIHEASLIKVDCVIRKETEYRNLEFSRRQRVTIADFSTFIVSKEDLILSKLVWGKDSRSEVQLRDVKNLLATDYDGDYLRVWSDKLGVRELLNECLT